MSGGHQPGATFKVKVIEINDDTTTLLADSEDLTYLEEGREYVAKFTPVSDGEPGGGNESGS